MMNKSEAVKHKNSKQCEMYHVDILSFLMTQWVNRHMIKIVERNCVDLMHFVFQWTNQRIWYQ